MISSLITKRFFFFFQLLIILPLFGQRSNLHIGNVKKKIMYLLVVVTKVNQITNGGRSVVSLTRQNRKRLTVQSAVDPGIPFKIKSLKKNKITATQHQQQQLLGP